MWWLLDNDWGNNNYWKTFQSPSKNIGTFFKSCFTPSLPSDHDVMATYLTYLTGSHHGFSEPMQQTTQTRIDWGSSLARGRPGGILSLRLCAPKPITPRAEPGVNAAFRVQSSRKIANRFSWSAQQALLGIDSVTRETRVSRSLYCKLELVPPITPTAQTTFLNRNKVLRLTTFITLCMFKFK